jgi:PAS domain S-box-containing protein
MAANTVGTDDARAPAGDPYRAVAEHLPDAAAVLFDLDLRIQLTTGTTMPDSDWLPERCVGRSLVDLAPPEQAEALAGSYRAALAGRPQHFETPGWRGPDRFWSVDVVPLHGESGAVSGGVAFWRDISQRHRAEEELLRHRRQLLDAQQLARVGSWEWEVDSSRVSWSPEMYRIMGVEPDTVLTRDRTSELLHPDDRGTRELRLARTLRDPSPFRGQFRAVRPDGTVVWLLGHVRGVRDLTGRVVRLVGSNQDITEAKQAEEERRRLLGRLYELVEGRHQRLAADLHDSHLQNLAAIGLRLDHAAVRLERGEAGLVRQLLGRLGQQVREELVALRRTVAALRPLVLDRRGLAAAVQELAAATGDRAGLDASDVTVDLNGHRLDPVVETVMFRVAQQALANVEQHANARRLRIALYRDGPQVVLAVEDDGCGFDPLHTETVTDAHGFGLSCMRERLQAIGGQLTLRTAPGAGTCIEARAAWHAPP